MLLGQFIVLAKLPRILLSNYNYTQTLAKVISNVAYQFSQISHHCILRSLYKTLIKLATTIQLAKHLVPFPFNNCLQIFTLTRSHSATARRGFRKRLIIICTHKKLISLKFNFAYLNHRTLLRTSWLHHIQVCIYLNLHKHIYLLQPKQTPYVRHFQEHCPKNHQSSLNHIVYGLRHP